MKNDLQENSIPLYPRKLFRRIKDKTVPGSHCFFVYLGEQKQLSGIELGWHERKHTIF
jgi:hypothetical protein